MRKIRFYWLNDNVREEVLSMNKIQLKTLKRSIERIETNSDLLNHNLAFVSFAESGIKELRELKKQSKNGYRVFFSLLPDLKTAVLIGKGSGKSATELPAREKDRLIELSKKVYNGKVAYSRSKFNVKLNGE